MEIIFRDYKYKDSLLDFNIKQDKINGIIGTEYNKLVEIIKLKNKYTGEILIDKNKLNKDNIKTYKKKIGIVEEEINDNIFTKSIYNLMEYEIIRRKLILKNPHKKIIDSLKIVGLKEDILERDIKTLSTSEKKLLQIAICLLSNPELIILIEPLKCLDIINEKKIILLLQKIKEQYNKSIVIVSNNSEVIYKYTKNIIVFNKDKIIYEGDTSKLFQKLDLLMENNINIPEIVEFTYKAKKKKSVKIDYHTDIRDIIKDIYKHV